MGNAKTADNFSQKKKEQPVAEETHPAGTMSSLELTKEQAKTFKTSDGKEPRAPPPSQPKQAKTFKTSDGKEPRAPPPSPQKSSERRRLASPSMRRLVEDINRA